jgi:hypothetical protein
MIFFIAPTPPTAGAFSLFRQVHPDVQLARLLPRCNLEALAENAQWEKRLAA